jgi:thiamine biosynthesis lipoprotein
MKSLSNEIRRARPWLGTLVEIGAVGKNAATAIEAAFREVETVHHLMSFHEENSDVSRINRASPGDILRIDRRTYEVLSCAQLLSRLSAGAFDITIGGKMVEEGFLPRPHGAASFDCEASFKDVTLLPDDSVTLSRPVWIDLGGIAKGYAVDRAAQVLRESGVTSGIVNAGGDLYVLGKAQPIHVRHPHDMSIILSLGTGANIAVASSSGFFNARDDNDPLIEPRRGTSVKWRQGITVVASRCMVADALTKVVRLAPRRAPNIIAYFNARALVIDRRGVRYSPPLESNHDLASRKKYRPRPTSECHRQFEEVRSSHAG